MSIALMTEAWKAELPSGRKFVLLSLCDNANDQGECYPSIAMIAKRCSMSVRAVQGHILALESDGVVVRVERIFLSCLFGSERQRYSPLSTRPFLSCLFGSEPATAIAGLLREFLSCLFGSEHGRI